MTDHYCFCDLAPLYALDLLTPEQRLWIEAQIAECPDLAEELAGYEAAVGSMPYTAPPMPMAANLKDRLFDRLGLDPVASSPHSQAQTSPAEPSEPEQFAIRAGELNWKPHRIEGVECALLFLDEVNRMRSMLVTAAAGVVYPLHEHRGVEEIYMLAGDLIIDNRTYLAGDYIRSHPNSIHAPSTNTGCKFLIRSCIDDNYDENSIARSH
ncbi:cupin domain-containing protein [Chamaesiphon minutus]|uniref:Anti-sigma factor n=1 Tax=Chamaesiphon minutus (strain ATCC 27169 / PCC 6605) TaxID=1173020 RepID=K9UKL3_CHAP6|nr:cupin domain-containing protein [Chamaesiphon minutus]AFY94986.1 anti-sigma factor [Chamaesiphon minutus PCC 6605]